MGTRKDVWFWVAMFGAVLYFAGCAVIMIWGFYYDYLCLVQDLCATRPKRELEYGHIVAFACWAGLAIFIIGSLRSLVVNGSFQDLQDKNDRLEKRDP